MTAQSHIDKIAQATWKVEKLSRETRRSAIQTQEAIKELHKLLDAAQNAYQAEHGGIQVMSGGVEKEPTPPNPDDPIPPPGS